MPACTPSVAGWFSQLVIWPIATFRMSSALAAAHIHARTAKHAASRNIARGKHFMGDPLVPGYGARAATAPLFRCWQSGMRASIQMTGDAVSRRSLLDGRHLGRATRHGEGTARMETAAGRRRQGARHLTLDRDTLALVVGMRRQGGGKQRLGIGMQRFVAQL